MNIETFLIKVEELFIEEKDSSEKYVIDRLDIQKTKLIELINDLDKGIDCYFKVKRDTVKTNIRDLFKEITNSVELFLNGRFEESSQVIYDRFLDPNSKKRITALRTRYINVDNKLEKNFNDKLESLNLFRVRSNNTYSLYNKEEMFHIPFEKRGLVTNQRYSMSGYPCLYLGSSIYGCWEATGRPNVDTFNVVSLKTTKGLYFIDLRIPQLNHVQFFNEEYIYQLILPLACSLKIKNSKDSFKPEYIIPQNILNGIIKRNYMHAKVEDNINWDGIMYTSNMYRRKECLFNDLDKLVNLVIPIKTSKEQGLCEELAKRFLMTESTSMLTERLIKNIRATFIFDEEAFQNNYINTMWGEIEETVLRKEFVKIE